MSRPVIKANEAFVLIGGRSGHTVIPSPTPLTRLNYFDGKFLRAEDLRLEQQYLRQLVALANQAGGAGAVHGFDCVLRGGDGLEVGPGLTVDPGGRALLLPQGTQVSLDELIEASRRSPALSGAEAPQVIQSAEFGECEVRAEAEPGEVLQGADLYLITVGWAEAHCGEEDVYGKLCEEACVTSTERPFVLEGVVIRAVPLSLVTPLKTSAAVSLSQLHLRSLVASAYFADERKRIGDLISADGLSSEAWCLGALPLGGQDVPIGVVARAGSTTLYLDAWTSRRERMETPPRQYWAWRMAMRPWNVFLAQILQFQCQLRDLFGGAPVPGGDVDPCADERVVLRDASKTMGELIDFYTQVSDRFATIRDVESLAVAELPVFAGGLTALKDLESKLVVAAQPVLPQRVLIRGGIVELPSAGYLPVAPSSILAVNKQVRQLLGEGLDLRFCVVRPDYVPHALEEAQHMERICLLQGLDNPKDKPRVDVLVPDGRVEVREGVTPGLGYEMSLILAPETAQIVLALLRLTPRLDQLGRLATSAAVSGVSTLAAKATTPQIRFYGAARGEDLQTGGSAFHFAGLLQPEKAKPTFERSPDLGFFPGEIPIRGGAFRSAAGQPVFAAAPGAFTSAVRAPTAIAQPVGGFAVAQPTKPSAAMWSTVSTDRDPLALEPRDVTGVEAGFIIVSFSSKTSQILDVRFSGALQIDSRTAGTQGETRVRAHLSGNAIVQRTLTGQTQIPPQSATVPLAETVFLTRRSQGGSAPSVEVDVPSGRLLAAVWAILRKRGNFRATRQGTPEGAEVRGALHLLGEHKPTPGAALDLPLASSVGAVSGIRVGDVLKAPTQELPLFLASQKRNDAVLAPGHAAHEASVSAVQRIGAALQDPRFADVAVRKLFPPPDPVPDELVVHATRDWVLFHRRRDIQCGPEVVPPVKVQPRRYRVYQVDLDDEAALEAFRKAMLGGVSIAAFRPQVIDVVEFGAGVQTVLSPHDDVRADWQMRVSAGAEIAFGAIASQGAVLDEGEALAAARLRSLVDVLESVTEVADAATFTVLPRVPDDLATGDKDGVVLLVTVGVATVCHEVYRLTLGANQVEEFLKLFQGDDLAGVLQRREAQRLGEVQFRSGTADIFMNTAAPVGQVWDEKGDGVLTDVIAISRRPPQGQPPADEVQLVQEQAINLAKVVARPEAQVSNHHVATASVLEPCPAVTVLVAQAEVCNEAYLFASATTASMFGQMVESIGAQGFTEEMLKPMQSLGSVRFPAGGTDPVPPSLEDVKNNLSELLPNGVPQGLSLRCMTVSKPSTTDAGSQVHTGQSAQVCVALGGSDDVAGVVSGGEAFPSDCDALTLVVPIRGDVDFTVVPVAVVRTDQPASEAEAEVAFRFDASGAILRDESYDLAIDKLKTSGVTLTTVELAGEKKPAAADKRLESLFTALKEEGLVTEETKTSTAKVAAADRPVLSQGGMKVPNVFLFKRG